jgi:hypothetical protein
MKMRQYTKAYRISTTFHDILIFGLAAATTTIKCVLHNVLYLTPNKYELSLPSVRFYTCEVICTSDYDIMCIVIVVYYISVSFRYLCIDFLKMEFC